MFNYIHFFFLKMINNIINKIKFYLALPEKYQYLLKEYITLKADNYKIIEKLEEYKKDKEYLNEYMDKLIIELKELKDENKKIENKNIVNLDKYKKDVYRNINGIKQLLNNWLKNPKEFDIMNEWIVNNYKFIIDDDIDNLVKKCQLALFDILKPNSNYETDGVKDVWNTVSKTIEELLNNYDCDDYATFAYYFIAVHLWKNNFWSKIDNLFFAIGGTLRTSGFLGENHAYLIWRAKDKQFYSLEGTWYPEISIKNFLKVNIGDENLHTHPALMSNYNNNYYKPII